MQTAQREPVKLLRMVQTFPYPEEVLAAISDRMLIVCTTVWGRVCIQERLAAYREWTTDKPTQRWLDTWKTKLSRPAPANLPSLDDSRDEWERLRTNAYGSDAALKLCDVGKKVALPPTLSVLVSTSGRLGC